MHDFQRAGQACRNLARLRQRHVSPSALSAQLAAEVRSDFARAAKLFRVAGAEQQAVEAEQEAEAGSVRIPWWAWLALLVLTMLIVLALLGY